MKLSFTICWVITLGVALIGSACSRKSIPALPDALYEDKVRGEWLGKCIGGALGVPLEGWNYLEIERKYGDIRDYVGYFNEKVTGSARPVEEMAVPRDGQWHKLRRRLVVPSFDPAKSHAVPTLHMASHTGKEPVTCEIRDLQYRASQRIAELSPTEWRGWYVKIPEKGHAVFSFPAEWEGTQLKLLPDQTQKLRLKPGEALEVSLEIKGVSGSARIGFAFDFLNNEPVQGFGPDDDTSYQIIGLHSLEKYGPDLSCRQIGQDWVELAPEGVDILLAEGLALQRLRAGILPPQSGEHRIGEAIGGQMRGEIWGLVCPGRPALAAEYARRDGVVAHSNNGVYGEQFIAAMMASAFFEKDLLTLIEQGLKQIPADSKYARVVRFAMELQKKHLNFRDALGQLKANYVFDSEVDVFADAGIVTLALLYGSGDFDKTLSIAASCGNDTDCNAASVGALLGCILGAEKLPEKWKKPVGDEFHCFVKGQESWKITELTKRICATGRKVMEFHHDKINFSKEL